MSEAFDGAQAASGTGSWHAIRRHRSRLAAAFALAALTMVSAAGSAAARQPSSAIDGHLSPAVTALELRPGDLVRDNGVGVEVPEPGFMTLGVIEFDDGTYQMLAVETDPSGSVQLLHWGDEAAGIDAYLHGAPAMAGADAPGSGLKAVESPDGSSGTHECSDRAYNRFSFRLPSLGWHYATGTTPSKFRDRTDGTKQVINAIESANRNITEARNLCGRADYIGATGSYLGTTDRGTNIDSSGSCTGRDGYSVVGWGNLPSSSVAMACIMGISSGGTASEGDVRINWNKPYETKMKWCQDEHLIEAAMTHEFGHIYGMAHVSSYSSPNLTMNPGIRQCSMAHASLGLGDMLGLETKY